jgi:ankyrin repeat protein
MLKRKILYVFLIMFLFGLTVVGEEIHDAARAGDLNKVKSLVAGDVKYVNTKTSRGTTPLHYACISRNADVVRFLIAKGADVTAVNDSLYTPLHYAASYDNTEAVELLLKHGADIEAKSREGGTPLHAAAASGAVNTIKVLTDKGADVRVRDKRSRTPLLLAARESGSVETAKILIARGSDIDAFDRGNDCALELSAWRGFKDFVNMLLDKGAKIPTQPKLRLSLLNHSVKRRLERLFQALVKAGIDLEKVKASRPGLIHAAATGGSTQIIGMLAKHGFDLGYTDQNGWTPLHCAAEFGRDNAVKFLLSKGVDINARTRMGENAFNIAQTEKNEKTAALLKSIGADTGPPRFPELTGQYLGQEKPGEKPIPFAPGIVTAHFGLHSSVTFSPDGKMAFWTIMVLPRESGYSTDRMLGTTLKNGKWTYPSQPEFKGGDVPFFSPDGKRLYFISDKPLTKDGGRKENIWFVENSKSGWSEPKPVDPIVNSAPMHWQFSIDKKGTFYIGSGDGRILVSPKINGKYQNPKDFKELYGIEGVKGGSPFISPEGDYLIFSRDDDLYITFQKTAGSWTVPQSLGDTINTSAYELCPLVTPDGEYLIYNTTRSGVWGPHWVAVKNTINKLRKQALAEKK